MGDLAKSYTVENYFMFDEEDFPNTSESKMNSSSFGKTRYTEFRADKPYRLALYVQPSLKRKSGIINSSAQATSVTQTRRIRNKENVRNCKQCKQVKLLKKNFNVSLFDEENETFNKSEKNNKQLLDKISTNNEVVSRNATKSILSYVDMNESLQKKPLNNTDLQSLPKTKQKKLCRSYEKKFKTYPADENIVEPPSEEILREMDVKKINKSKVKKSNKDEEEFEKWAENMNSAFDDIDKFELSINYD